MSDRARGLGRMDAPDFSVDDFMGLEPAERVRLCRNMAERAKALAERASPAHRSGYAELARQWDLLAQEMERVAPVWSAARLNQ